MKIGLYLDKVSMHILNKGLFVSCEPVERIDAVQPGLVDERLNEKGNVFLVCDLEKEIQGKAKLSDAFITTFGDPDPLCSRTWDSQIMLKNSNLNTLDYLKNNSLNSH